MNLHTMWQRFSENARRVIFHGQELAMKAGDTNVSTEHLLLGILLLGQGIGATTLQRLGISEAQIRTEMSLLDNYRPPKETSDMTLSVAAKQTIDFAYDEARALQNNYIGTEHILLGILRESGDLGGRVLRQLGVSIDTARDVVATIQAEGNRTYEAGGASSPAAPPTSGSSISEQSAVGGWQRFDVSGRKTVFYAIQEAQKGGSFVVTPEYLLLGIFKERDTSAEEVLTQLNFDVEKIRKAVKDGIQSNSTEITDDIKLNQEAEQIIDFAYEEAALLHGKPISTEILLLALIRDTGTVGQVFAQFGVDIEAARAVVRERMA